MRVDAYALQSWSPKRAFRMLDKCKPHSSPLFYLSLTEIAISSSWVRSVDEYVGSGSVRELLANNSSSTYRDDLAYCWDALSIWLQSHVEAAYWLGVQRLFERRPKAIWARSSWFSCFNFFVYRSRISFITYTFLVFFPSFSTKLEIVRRH